MKNGRLYESYFTTATESSVQLVVAKVLSLVLAANMKQVSSLDVVASFFFLPGEVRF